MQNRLLTEYFIYFNVSIKYYVFFWAVVAQTQVHIQNARRTRLFILISIRWQLFHAHWHLRHIRRSHITVLRHALTTNANGNERTKKNITLLNWLLRIFIVWIVEIWNFIWFRCCISIVLLSIGCRCVSIYFGFRNRSMETLAAETCPNVIARAAQNRWPAHTVGRLIALSHPKILCNSIIIWRMKIQKRNTYIQFMLINGERSPCGMRAFAYIFGFGND